MNERMREIGEIGEGGAVGLDMELSFGVHGPDRQQLVLHLLLSGEGSAIGTGKEKAAAAAAAWMALGDMTVGRGREGTLSGKLRRAAEPRRLSAATS